jgi:colicin import membrane protein
MFSLQSLKNAASAAAQKATNAARGVAKVAGQSGRFADLEAATKSALGVQSSPRAGSAAAAAAQQKANAAAANVKAKANAAAANVKAKANAAAAAAAANAKAKANAAAANAKAKANAAAAAAAAATARAEAAATEQALIKDYDSFLLPTERAYREAYNAYWKSPMRQSPMNDSSPPDEPASYKDFQGRTFGQELKKRSEDPEYYSQVQNLEKEQSAQAATRRASAPRRNTGNPGGEHNFRSLYKGGRRTRRKRHMKRKHRTRRHR